MPKKTINKIEKYKGKEDKFQELAVRLISLLRPDAFFIHVPNGGKRNVIEAAKLKRMGVKAGVPDILMFNPKGRYLGLALELKVDGGKVSEAQELFMMRLKVEGWRVEVVWNFEQIETIVKDYFR